MLSRFAVLVALLASGPAVDRVARWRQDIAVAREQFLPKDQSYSAERRAPARRRLDRLAEHVADRSDAQIVAELASVAALAGNGHTRAYLLRNRGWWRRYPIRIWKFDDGWRIVAVRPGGERLLGARLLTIAGRPVRVAEAAVRPLFAGPDSWGSYMASYSLTSPDALQGTGVLDADELWLGLEQAGRRFTETLAPARDPRRAAPEESWWFLAPGHPGAEGWVQALPAKALPPYLAQPSLWYDLRRCEGDILYLRFSRAEDQPGRPTLAEFSQQVLADVAAVPGARLVIDLRFNTGGNLQKTRTLFEQLAATAQGRTSGRLFVILGRSTFSAGITPAAILKQNGRPTLVGTAPGDHSTFWAEGGNVTLPNSGLILHYADRAHLYGPSARPIPPELVYLRLRAGDLSPDRPAGLRYAEYRAGRDPSAERVVPAGLRCDAGS